MKMLKRNKKSIWVVLIILLIAEILFDPLSRIFYKMKNVEARIRLPVASRHWDEQNIVHYKFDVNAGGLADACIWQANLEVDNGVVVKAGRRSDWPDDLSTVDYPVFPLREPQIQSDWFMCDYHNFTLPKLFDVLEEIMQKNPSSITSISFDDQYGFISGVRFGTPAARGILSPTIDHCCSGFGISNFQVLDDKP